MRIEGTVRGPRREETLEFLVDSGVMYSLLPQDVWKKLGLEPQRTVSLTLVDGTHLDRAVSECEFLLSQGHAHSPVMLGEPGDVALLGTVMLAALGLMLNPYKREIQPMKMLLMPAR